MDQQNKHSTFRRWGKRLLWLFVAIMLLGISLRLSLKTAFVQDRVRKAIVSTANGQLNAQLSIGKLSGDLWKDITLSQLTLMREDTIAHIDSVHVSYRVWALLSGKIEVRDLEMYRPKMNIRKDVEGWNFEHLVVESSDTAESPIMPFAVQNFSIDDGSASVKSDSLPLGGSYTIGHMNLASSFGYDGNDFTVDLRDFSLHIAEDNLEQSLEIDAMASFKDQKVTLEQLVMATGQSILEANGYANMADTSLQFGMASNPLYWSDIAAFIEDYPIRKNVDLKVSVEGNPEKFNLSVLVNGEGIQSLEINSRFGWQSDLIVERISTTAQSVDMASLLADSAMPRFEKLNIGFNGRLNIADLANTSGELSFSASEITSNPYSIQTLTGNGSVKDKSITLTLEASEDKQRLKADVSARNIWSDQPFVSGRITGKTINPGHWIQDTTYNGNLSFGLSFDGVGWYPQKESWKYNGRMHQSTLMGHNITEAFLRGKVSNTDVTVDGGIRFDAGRIDLEGALREMATTKPSYRYQLKTENLNLGGLLTEQDFSTSINAVIKGQGKGVDPATMQLQSTVDVGSSTINGAMLDSTFAAVSIRDSVVSVDGVRLSSGIADGSFNARLNILDLYNVNNELLLDLQLKQLAPLAPLANAENLQATGNITGRLNPAQNQGLRFLGTMDMSEVAYDSLFMSDRLRGSVDLNLGERLLYLADLNLENPNFSGVPLQNVSLRARGNYREGVADGQYDFQFSSSTEGRIEQSGTYQVATDSISINTNELNFISDYRTLTLEESFELRYQNDALQMDTLRISSGDGSFFEAGLPIISKDEQRGFIKGKALNTAVIQSSLLGETYFRGMLSGDFQIDRQGTDLQATGNMLLSDIHFEGADFDSLLITSDIADERMQGTISLKDEGNELISGQTNLPFKLGDPETFQEDFFNEQVSGDLRVYDISIERFQSFFDEYENFQTSGLVSFWGTLDGTAGNPEFDADATFKNASLSGVAVDSITAGANYRHSDEELTLDATVISLNQQAAQISARLPLFIDMKTFNVDYPQQKDHIAVNIETNEFNLRALNDFIDPLFLREVRGFLDGSVQVKGAVEDLKTDGDLELKQGKFRLVPAGITVEKITSKVNFAPNHIQLSSFSAQSGSGSIKASGKVALQELIPGDIDISVNAKNFRAANTPEYNAVINLNARAQGTVTSPKISGSLDFLSGFIKLDNFGEKSVETVKLDAEDEQESSFSVYDSLALDMDIGFNRRFFIQNKRYLEMEIELDGMLDLVKKSGGDLELFGDMNAPNGYARPFGKRFDLEEGVVTFSGNPENPQLRIRTKYEPPQTQENIVIWYVIEGTVENPQFRYESQPPMELENIISYTLFGQPFYALDSWKQVVASSGSNTTAADVALDVLLDRVETLATQQLGIDVVRIDNTHSGGETGTSIMTGWYLNPKVFFAIQNVITGSTPETGFLLEYMLRKDLKLILRQGNNIRQGVDLKWNYDY